MMNVFLKILWILTGSWTLLLLEVFGKEHVRIAFLEATENRTGVDLKMYYSVNQTERTLAQNIRIGQKNWILSSSERSGRICWVGQVENEEADGEIHCYRHDNSSVVAIALPRVTPKRNATAQQKSVEITTSRNVFIELDIFGTNVYWRDGTSGNIWATSLDSRASRLLVRYPTAVDGTPTVTNEYLTDQSWLYFSLDTLNGYFIGESVLLREHIMTPYRTRLHTIPLQGIGPEPEESDEAVAITLLRWDPNDHGKVTTDPGRKRTYGMWHPWEAHSNLSQEIIQVSYDDLLNVEEIHLLEVNDVNIRKTQLQYFDGNLYWSGSINGTLSSLHLDSRNLKRISRRENFPFPSFYTLYENTREGLNPCTELQCSHLCLPSFAKGYSCTCPSGMSFVSSNECRSGEIIGMIVKNRNVYRIPPFRDDLQTTGYNYTLCRAAIEGNLTAKHYNENNLEGVPVCKLETSLNIFKRLKPIQKHPAKYGRMYNVNFEADPWGLGFFEFFHKDTCIKMFSFKTGVSSSVFCFSTTLLYFTIDFSHWNIFTVEESASKFSVVGRKIQSLQVLHRFLLEQAPAGLAADDIRKKLFWLIRPSTLVSSNYDGSGRQILSEKESFTDAANDPDLRYFGNRLFWYQDDSPSNHLHQGIVAYDLDTQLKTRLTNRYLEYMILPPLKLVPHPCSESNCSHNCIPLSDSSYTCTCPSLFVKLGSGDCAAITATLIYGEGSKINMMRVPLIELKQNTSKGTPFNSLDATTPLGEETKNLIFGSRPSHNATCWFLKKSGIVNCRGEEQTLQVCEIHPNSSMFAFDTRGKEIFFNDGYYGNMSVRSLTTDSVYKFPEFLVIDLVSWSMDTQRNILFWSDKADRINFRVLYEKNKDEVIAESLGAAKVLAISADVYSRSLYFVQGRAIKRMSYNDLFTGSNTRITLRVLREKHNFRDFQYYSKSLYYITSEAQTAEDGTWPSAVVEFKVTNYDYSVVAIPKEIANLRFPQSSNEKIQADPCSNAKCSHFCFPASASLVQDAIVAHQCACPQGLTLVQERICEETREPEAEDPTVVIVWSTVGGIALLLLFSGLTAALVVKTRKTRVLANLVNEIKNGRPQTSQKTAKNDPETAQHLPLTCIIPGSELEISKNKILGEGAFGRVLRGVYQNSIVAVKTLKPSYRVNQLSDFAKEVKVMHYVGHHPHIVGFLGAEISNIKQGSFYAVIEFSPHGTLTQYLRQREPKPGEKQYEKVSCETETSVAMSTTTIEIELPPSLVPTATERTDIESDSSTSIPIGTLVDWAEQIACAMDYLSSKSVIHGDLAARNILVFDNQVVKVSDFGLSRKLYHYTTYKKSSGKMLPWRWMAIESLKFLTFSTKTDVWSYGATLWEMFTFGQVPYLEYQWNPTFIQKLENGLTLTKPEFTPDFIYNDIMKTCWRLDSKQRPCFTSIMKAIKTYRRSLRSSVEYEDL